MDDWLFGRMQTMHEANISFSDKNDHFPELAALPDGAVLVKEANTRKLKYNI